jgi:hypothetical protein
VRENLSPRGDGPQRVDAWPTWLRHTVDVEHLLSEDSIALVDGLTSYLCVVVERGAPQAAKRASDLGVCLAGPFVVVRGDQCSRVLPQNYRTGSRRGPDAVGHSRPWEVGTCVGHPAPSEVADAPVDGLPQNQMRRPRQGQVRRSRATVVAASNATTAPMRANATYIHQAVGDTYTGWMTCIPFARVLPSGA